MGTAQQLDKQDTKFEEMVKKTILIEHGNMELEQT